MQVFFVYYRTFEIGEDPNTLETTRQSCCAIVPSASICLYILSVLTAIDRNFLSSIIPSVKSFVTKSSSVSEALL
jgi:hypothetical protein